MKRRLVTSALPYVNNIPHLGNLIQVLSADVFARFCRQHGYETLYVCGTDEYGTATETRALEEGVSPQELCDRYYRIHRDIYRWFEIEFDHFGRTSRPVQTQVVQNLFKKVDQAGFITEGAVEQLYCENDRRFLADRYVNGTCPHCDYRDARGDQCESCGKLLDPTDLRDPRCGTCGGTPVIKKTRHLYLDLPALMPVLQKWLDRAKVQGFWANNAVRMTESWIRDGLKSRSVTRDLKWGIPVPREGFEEKVFYVWFDAPIGYVSITADFTDEWEKWWRSPDETELYQFIGKDNIPFHTVIFPATQLASGERWTMLHHMSSSEYLNYENGKFSKSKGVGVFGSDCRDTGIGADVWRFYIFYNRPETADYQFNWADFQEAVNGELIGNLANFVNRVLSFINRFYEGCVPQAALDENLRARAAELESGITAKLERAELRGAFRDIFALSDLGNKAFQAAEPWRTRTEDPPAAAAIIRTLALLVRDLAILIKPYMPAAADRIAGFLQFTIAADSWALLGSPQGLQQIESPQILFEKLETDRINALRTRFAGSQGERGEDAGGKAAQASQSQAAEAQSQAAQAKAGEAAPEPQAAQEQTAQVSPEDSFAALDLRAARILKAEQHPNADRLFVITLDAGGGEERVICSGLVGHCTPEDLEGKTIVLAFNLKPAKFRGVKSHGMLLAAEDADGGLEVLMCGAAPGERAGLKGTPPGDPPAGRVSINRFFETPIHVEDGAVLVGRSALILGGAPLRTSAVLNGKVG